MTDVVHEGCGYELDGFDVEVPSPFLELRHAHYQVAYETIDCVAKVCELFRVHGDDLGVSLIVFCEKADEELLEIGVYALSEHDVLVEDPFTDDLDDIFKSEDRWVGALVCGIFFNDGVPSAIGLGALNVVELCHWTVDPDRLGPGPVANCMFVLKLVMWRATELRLSSESCGSKA